MKSPSFCTGLRVVCTAALLISPLCAADDSPGSSPAAAPDLRSILRDALFEEEATRDLNKAAAGYESLLTKWGEQRQIAAAALFRLAEVRRKQDRKDDAIKLYQRLITEFADQDPHARLSRENLAALGAKEPSPSAPATPAVSDEEAAALARMQKLAVESPDLLTGGEFNKACEKGWLSVVKFLHARGVTGDSDAMLNAARAGHLAVCQELLAHAPSPEHLAWGVEAATNAQRPAVLKLLLENGASPDGRPERDTAPLTSAIQAGNTAVIDLLLAHKAKVDPPNAGMPPLFAAARFGNAAMVKRLLEAGADPKRGLPQQPQDPARHPQARENFTEAAMSTPLHAAATSDSVECVSLLLKAGADANAANAADYTPLHNAAIFGDTAAIELLLAAGAKPDGLPPTAGKNVHSPLWLAVSSGKVPAVAALLKAKADPNILFNDCTPAALALENEDEKTRDKILALLLEHGADPTAGNHSAIQSAPPALKVKLLRSHQYPKLATKPEVTLVFGDQARESVLAPRRTPDEKPAPLPALLLAWHDRGGWGAKFQNPPDWSALRLFRKGDDGKMAETVLPIRSGAEFPELQWGDVIEVVSDNWEAPPPLPQPGIALAPGPRVRRAGTPEGATNGLPPETLAILRDTQTARIKLTAGGVTRDLTLRGSLRTWNPLSNEAPLVPLSVLAAWCGANSTRFATTVSVRLRRAAASGGGDGVYISTDRTLASLMPRDGDEITLLEPKETRRENSFPRIGYHSPQQPFGGMIVPAKGGNTLFQLLAELYAAPPIGTWHPDAFNADGTPTDPATLAEKLTDHSLRFQVLPHPDFSRIRVTRSDQHTDYDLVKAAAALTDNATAEEARKHDVELLDIDHVEIPILSDTAKPFTALPQKVERLLSLAVSCRVTLDDQKGELRAVTGQWLPARYVETPAGLLPVPAYPEREGVIRLPTVTAPALVTYLIGDPYRITGVARASSRQFKASESGWLREGDRIIMGALDAPPSILGGQYPGSPVPLPANTTSVP